MEVFATFDIYNSKEEKVAEGHKASFCLEDNQCLNGVEPKYFCANYGDQGRYFALLRIRCLFSRQPTKFENF
jgi:Lysyl oxidase